MDHSSVDLNLVKREPGLDDMYSSDPVIFDGMMGLGEDFNDSFHSSMVGDNLDTLNTEHICVNYSAVKCV